MTINDDINRLNSIPFPKLPILPTSDWIDKEFWRNPHETLKSMPNYPPFNIIEFKTGDERLGVQIEIACAGFDRSELKVETERDILTISGTVSDNECADSSRKVVRERKRGIKRSNWHLSFRLFDSIIEDVTYENGILSVNVVEVADEAKAKRSYEINTVKQLHNKGDPEVLMENKT